MTDMSAQPQGAEAPVVTPTGIVKAAIIVLTVPILLVLAWITAQHVVGFVAKVYLSIAPWTAAPWMGVNDSAPVASFLAIWFCAASAVSAFSISAAARSRWSFWLSLPLISLGSLTVFSSAGLALHGLLTLAGVGVRHTTTASALLPLSCAVVLAYYWIFINLPGKNAPN